MRLKYIFCFDFFRKIGTLLAYENHLCDGRYYLWFMKGCDGLVDRSSF